MPQAFNSVSTEETAGLESNVDAQNDIHVERPTRCKYVYISKKAQTFLAASAAVLSLSFIILHLSITKGSPKGQWPPPGVYVEQYTDFMYVNKKPATFQFELKTGKSYKQFTKLTTTSEYDFDQSDFVETLHMMIDGTLDVKEWTYEGEHSGQKIGVTFDQVAVTTSDSSGDSTYYSSLAQNGDSDFDEVLQSMTGEKIIIDVTDDFLVVDEEDNENALKELEQEYSYGTTTGLSAIDQISQLSNLISFLPRDKTASYKPGDSWEITYDSDIIFEGRSTFEGYVKYNGYECAVIQSYGYINQDEQNFLGDGVDDWQLDSFVEIENGSIDATIFWDLENNIPRFALLNIDMTTEIEEQIDEDEAGENQTVELPMTETIEMYMAPLN